MTDAPVLVLDSPATRDDVRLALEAATRKTEAPVVVLTAEPEPPAAPPLTPIKVNPSKAFNLNRPSKMLTSRSVLLDREEERIFTLAATTFTDAVRPGEVEHAREEFHRVALGVGALMLSDPAYQSAWTQYVDVAKRLNQEADLKQFTVIICRAGYAALHALEQRRKVAETALAEAQASVIVDPGKLIVTPEEARRQAGA